jgi:hypothetical protein
MFIQPPDFGIDFNHVGKSAKRVNGSARAIANPNIPTAGAMMLPVVETSTKRKPMIGPVHEKETKVKVNAIKKIATIPLAFSALLSTAVLHEEGKVISKAPKKEAAKITNIKKKMMLKMAFVESEFRALAPKIKVMAKPSTK